MISKLSPIAQGKTAAMLMVRDPRDCLVSMYFSFLHSHAAPKSSNYNPKKDINRVTLPDIDEYVLSKADWYNSLLLSMLAFLENTHSHQVIRYEDCVQNKFYLCKIIYDLLLKMASEEPADEFESNRKIASSYLPPWTHLFLLKMISKMHDSIPSRENPNRHVRKATPGDHINKLKTDTIAQLNGIFSDTLKAWY
jgi:hypothetical protein